MTPTRDDVLAAARILYGDHQLAEVLATLDSYGTQAHELEVNRVKLAVLHLSEGQNEKLAYLVGCAKVDYRDVLAWREVGALSSDQGAQLGARAQALIDRWGKK